MKIGFDGRHAEGDLVGVGKYIRSLLLKLSERGIECIVFYSRNPKFKIAGRNIKSRVLNCSNRYIFEQILLPFALKKEKVDLYHALGNVGIPVFCPVPSTVTVHDIIPFEIEDYFSYSPFPVLSKLSYNLRLRSSVVKASKIVTVSEYVKEQLIKKLGVAPSKVRTIYSGSPVLEKSGIFPKNLVGKKYILNHGGIDIRKNLDKLIEAFSIFRNDHKNINLVVTGENKLIKKELDYLVNKLDLKSLVIFTGYVDDKTLGAIVRSASAVCYPTLSEGFGFPILEAFAAGVPVISSNTSAIPEVAGDGAILIDPVNVEEIAKAMARVLGDKELRESMVLKGKEQYNKFDWGKSANEYLDLYNSIK